MLKNLLRKKSVSKILADAEKGYGDHGNSLQKTLGVRDLTAFGIAAIIGAGIFSTIGKRVPTVGLLWCFYLFLLRSPVASRRLLMQNSLPWCRYLAVPTPILM